MAEAPTVRRLPESGKVEVAERENTTLRCQVTGKPRPRVSWASLGRAGDGEGEIFNMVGVTRHQAGNISCTADNGVGQPVTATFSLTVSCTSLPLPPP